MGLIFLLLMIGVAQAQTVTVIDNSTISVSTTQSIGAIREQIDIYQKEKAKWDAQYDALIAPLQAKIDEAAEQGAGDAIELDVQGTSRIQ